MECHSKNIFLLLLKPSYMTVLFCGMLIWTETSQIGQPPSITLFQTLGYNKKEREQWAEREEESKRSMNKLRQP